MAEDSIDKMKNSSGSVIIPDETSVVAQIFRDKIDLVANAIGASISQIKRDEALQNGEQKRENK